MRGDAGKPLTLISFCVSMSSKPSPVWKLKRLAEYVRGLMRKPASFSSGCATSLMPGKDGVGSTAARLRFGLRLRVGARGASTMACRGAGGA